MRNAEDMEELDAYYRDEEPPPRACPECGDDDRHQPDCSRNHRAREYRDDDETKGYCPVCSKPLPWLTMAYKGYCETHAWVYADFSPKVASHD